MKSSTLQNSLLFVIALCLIVITLCQLGVINRTGEPISVNIKSVGQSKDLKGALPVFVEE